VEIGSRISDGSLEREIDDITCRELGAVLGTKAEDELELELAWAYMTASGLAGPVSY
jgi:hypothetical protein